MIRHCNGTDPNLRTLDGQRGNCGRSFDDVTHLATCPHDPINNGMARELLNYLASPILTLDADAAMRYRLYADEGRVYIQCEPCLGIPAHHRTSPHPIYSTTRGLVDAIAWARYHELTTAHTPLAKRDVNQPCLSRHPAYGRCVSFRGHLPRTHVNLLDQDWSDEDAAVAWIRAEQQAGGKTYADAIAEALNVPADRVREVLAEVDPDDTLMANEAPPADIAEATATAPPLRTYIPVDPGQVADAIAEASIADNADTVVMGAVRDARRY